MLTYGLIGKSLKHSFSKQYFSDKFVKEDITNTEYLLFELEEVRTVKKLASDYPMLSGFNVTIPYKEEIISLLDMVEQTAKQIGAVNTVKISNGLWTGYNTDIIGFEESLKPLLRAQHSNALILGTGGAGKAIKFVLSQLGIQFKEVSRNPKDNQLSYAEAAEAAKEHYLIINTTPAGTFPHINEMPPLPLLYIGQKHLVYDLIYNPAETALLKKCREKGAQTKNGLEMLQLQAEKAWQIWQDV